MCFYETGSSAAKQNPHHQHHLHNPHRRQPSRLQPPDAARPRKWRDVFLSPVGGERWGRIRDWGRTKFGRGLEKTAEFVSLWVG